jgi:hypothetical protein
MSCPVTLGPGSTESIRVSNLRECVVSVNPPLIPNIDVCPECRKDKPHGTRLLTTPTETTRTLKKAVRCPIYYKSTVIGGHCGLLAAAAHRPANLELLEKGTTTGPYGLHQYRVYDRIRGIDEIAQVVRTPSSSEVLARRRANIINAERRHAEHFRPVIPPPPRLCRVPRTTPQPGVPIAPTTPCILGNQRVDYHNPRR